MVSKKEITDVKPGIEVIQYKGKVIGLCVRNYFKWDETKFLVEDDFYQQIGLLFYKKGEIVRAHAHRKIPRTVNFTTEVLFCVSGRIVYTFYDEKENWRKINSCELTSSDLLCLFGAGHGGKALEPTRLIEVKQGPYLGPQDKFFSPERVAERKDES